MANLLKTLTLTLDTKHVECQLDTAELVDEPATEEVVTFCGTDSSSSANYKLNLGGFQDWGSVDGVCDILHTAYIADPPEEVAFVVTAGGKTRTGTAKPVSDVPFGGGAGSPLKFSVVLDVVGTPTDGSAA